MTIRLRDVHGDEVTVSVDPPEVELCVHDYTLDEDDTLSQGYANSYLSPETARELAAALNAAADRIDTGGGASE